MMSPTEEWRDVPGFENLYAVSNLGAVRSKARVVIRKNGVPNSVKELALNPCVRGGYLAVSLYQTGKRGVMAFVHRLVAAAFIGPLPDGMEVCHGDGCRSNNVVTNLRYGTRSDNVRDAIKHGTHFTPWRGIKGETHPRSKLTNLDVVSIRASGEPVMTLAKHYGVAHSLIRRIKNREAWRHV